MKYQWLTVFSLQTPGREFLLRVSYLEIYNEVCSITLDINFTICGMGFATVIFLWLVSLWVLIRKIIMSTMSVKWKLYYLWCFLFVYYQVINDLLDPTGQNLRVREDAQVSCIPWETCYVLISLLHRILILSYVLFIHHHFHLSLSLSLSFLLLLLHYLFLLFLSKGHI